MLLAALWLWTTPLVPADPLTPAATGQVQCTEPDEARKTCFALASYRPAGGKAYKVKSQVIVIPDAPIILETETIVTVEDGAVCGQVTAADLTDGTLIVGEEKVPAEKAAPQLARLATAMAPLLDKLICTTYAPSPAGGQVARSTIGGIHQPPDQRVIWVGPDEGWKVAR